MTSSILTSTNADNLAGAAALDAVRIEVERATDAVSQLTGTLADIDLDKVGADDARKIMSAEHKALGYRPPPGSLAAEAQAAAAKHPEAQLGIDATVLRDAAVEDAARISSKRRPSLEQAHPEIDLEKVGAVEARTIMSAEHKALGYRPPPGSLAAEAQAAAAKHPEAHLDVDPATLREAAREDAARIARERDPDVAPSAVDLAQVGTRDAAQIESAEHKELGYRPPATSLAAAAKAAASEHPDASAGVTKKVLEEVAKEDALRVKEERGEVPAEGAQPLKTSEGADEVAINLGTITKDEAQALQSTEQKILGYRPPADSLAAQAQSAADTRDSVPVTKEMAAELMFDEQKARDGQRPPAGTIAPVAQSLADKNEQDGGERTLGDA